VLHSDSKQNQTPTMNHWRIHRKNWCRSGADGETPIITPPTIASTSCKGIGTRGWWRRGVKRVQVARVC